MSPLRGNAGFRYTPVDDETEVTVQLNAPLQEVEAAVRIRAYAWDAESLLPEHRETVTTGGPVREIRALIPMHPNSGELLTMLEHMVMGAVAT